MVQLQPGRIELAARNLQETSGTVTALYCQSPILENKFLGGGVPQNERKNGINFEGGPTYYLKKFTCWEKSHNNMSRCKGGMFTDPNGKHWRTMQPLWAEE